jgi:hypothetical protein
MGRESHTPPPPRGGLCECAEIVNYILPGGWLDGWMVGELDGWMVGESREKQVLP